MSTPKIPSPGKIFLSILSAKWEKFWPALLLTLEKKWGKADYLSDLIPFSQTKYYDAELGTPIFRRVLSFSNLIPLDQLVSLKQFTNQLEQLNLQNNNRIFNLDPGIITYERLVLATGKNFTHRIYLKEGIFADLTLIYTKGKWQTLPWTFPDYATHEMQQHLTNIRNIYRQQLQNK
ncbi:protein of unknown function [Desulfonauticus submarinus]|uniref:GTP-binding protein n=1 Tax=Desulfonauticus submarinus TaxID=206665 RepID=A0A1H0CM19_9BACT|nr:DUF4416 family protein [Desulfonauticus submarinus]SDN58914.1 protein of unknown function [Desulfonauticus submarinus]